MHYSYDLATANTNTTTSTLQLSMCDLISYMYVYMSGVWYSVFLEALVFDTFVVDSQKNHILSTRQ